MTGVFPAISDTCLEVTRRAIAVMREAGRSLSFDPNLRPTLWASQDVMRDTLNELALQCQTVLPGVAEGLLLTGSTDPVAIARFYRERGVGAGRSSSSARTARTSTTATQAAATCRRFRWQRWSTPSAPATASRSA